MKLNSGSCALKRGDAGENSIKTSAYAIILTYGAKSVND